MTKYNGLTDVAVLEHAIRSELNTNALRRLAVLRPLKVVITNIPEGQTEELAATNNPASRNSGRARFRLDARFSSNRMTSWKSPRRSISA